MKSADQPPQPDTGSILQLASLAYMHIKLHICKIGQAARGMIVLLNKGSQRLQGILDVLACTQHRKTHHAVHQLSANCLACIVDRSSNVAYNTGRHVLLLNRCAGLLHS